MWEWGDPSHPEALGTKALSAAFTGGLATAVTVPLAAAAGGADSLPYTLAGTVLGFAAGVGSWLLAVGVPNGEFRALPVFSVTMASLTTVIATSPPRP